MIKEIKSIENLAVFQNFEWAKSVLDQDGRVVDCKNINIIYGRNYSGKTTLSRILRAIENGKISNKFENPRFCIAFADGIEIKETGLTGHGKKVRVFNEDFCRENLKFINNPDESIESFAILGNLNNEIEEKIRLIEEEIGIDEEGNKTGLYAQLKQYTDSFNAARNAHEARRLQLDGQLNSKATNREVGIKYKPEKFGDQNYSRPKLDRDISIVQNVSYTPITNLEQTDAEALLIETINPTIPASPKISLEFKELTSEAKILIEKEIGESGKIEELVKDVILNRWVKEGRNLHKGSREKCAFCDNEIKQDRWQQLENHFDEESDKLETAIDNLIKRVDLEIEKVKSEFSYNKDLFYSKFHKKLKKIADIYLIISKDYQEKLSLVKSQLQIRKDNLITPKSFQNTEDYSKRLNYIFDIYDSLRTESNSYSSRLINDQTQVKEKLRLKEVSDFLKTIRYSDEIEEIKKLKDTEDEVRSKKSQTAQSIEGKKQEINNYRSQLKDESKGADKVNEYLNNFFGHGFLSLKAIELENIGGERKFKFEVIRNDKKAYHLSEGEASLISFCYFMAKLEDIETKGEKLVIWIDDPISSLDGNHIFFIYSLLKSEIVAKHIFAQLFISTHNLDFLKYMKRLSGKNEHNQEYTKSYFIVQRNGKNSTISVMPKYLKEFVTEFNYLFHQIFMCSKINVIDDSNYTVFYNFGNNARKFLELYLYYKYPDGKEDKTNQKLQSFFGDEQIPILLIDRINNEYSHLAGIFERGATPTEVPEMKLAADLIIRRIKEIDEEQYKSLLVSIGEHVV